MSLVKELWAFMKARKKWWLMPLILLPLKPHLSSARGKALS